MFEFGLPSIIAYSPKNITVLPVQFVAVVSFFKIQFIVFSLKSMTSSTPLNCLLSNPFTLSSFSNMEHHIQKWFIHIKVYFVLSKKEEHISSRSSRHFVPTDQNKLCTHDKNRKRAELWVKINLFNVFVMYALGSVHEKFDV